MRLRLLLPFFLVACAGCTTSQPKRRPIVTVGDPELQLLQTDRDFSQLAQQAGASTAFSRYSDAATIRITASGPLVQGGEQIRIALQQMPPGSVLAWIPREAHVALSGDLGWTWGDFEYRPAPGDMSAPSHGRYLTVWHRSGDGSWRISADIGNEATQ
jgi:ketosteroid isomerase-like protein